MSKRGRWLRALAIAAVMTGVVPATATAVEPITSSFATDDSGACPVYGEQEICTGQVPSFDGTPLDVDVTKPLNDSGAGRHPLIVMLHGFGNDKHEWQSTTDEGDGADKWHWNSHWFAKHGFYVLTYTARGFDSRDGRGHEPQTPRGSSKSEPNGRIRLKSRDWEIRDTQYLAALVAQAYPDVDRERVAVTGGSYGGGESWLQASQARWTFPERFGLPALSLQVAIPKYPWTDLAYGLGPNGHPGPVGAGGGRPDYPGADPIYESSQGAPTSQVGAGNPIGVPKASYLAGLFATGLRTGSYERITTPPSNQATSEEGPIDIPAWVARVNAGDPYQDGDPVIDQIRRGLTEFRSAYYQEDGWAAQDTRRKVAIFSIQGWTDDLFTAVESFRMFKYLKRLDPRWPVEVEVADVGHARAQNKPETWRRLNAQAFNFVQEQINGSHEQETHVSSEPTICANDGEPDNNDTAAQRLTAQTPEGLANGRLRVGYPGGVLTGASGATDPNGPRTDPVIGGLIDDALFGGGPCRTSDEPALGAYTAVSSPLRDATTYVGLGSVALPYRLLPPVGVTATINARVWDVAPDGTTVLMTRGTYRFKLPEYDNAAGRIRLPLFGNHWQLKPGHRIRLDLAEVDAGTFRPSNGGSVFQFDQATLELPIREAADRHLDGALAPAPALTP